MTNKEIRAWRDLMGLNQVQAARALKIDAQRLRAYEKGRWPNGNDATVPDSIAAHCEDMLAIRLMNRTIEQRAKGK